MPRIREWPRMSTTLVNAYLEPVLTAYLRSLDQQLAERDVTTSQRYLMQSNGGVMPFSAAIRGGRTHHTLLSGPAAGVVSAAFLCATQGFRNLVSLDIGGTSADVAFVEGGVPVEVTQGQIEGRTVYAPMVDVEAVSAGGGTIARVDSGGLLRVGPDSAGSDPGPACYGRSGTEATITDADMALGYLDPDYFLGGAMSLDPAASERALMEGVGKPLRRRSPQEAAWGIVKVIEVQMADRILALA
ncbi:MAG: hydantoinase/oxoprolinase family protein, partial [Chloroflexi bacterium]|nr:hydantoinase/oxoprolinase family protein [Chloroflexota bacterium]